MRQEADKLMNLNLLQGSKSATASHRFLFRNSAEAAV